MDEMDLVRQLRELAELHSAGSITDEEFTLAKERILSRTRDSIESATQAGASFGTEPAATAPLAHGTEKQGAFPVGGTGGGWAPVTVIIGGAVTLLAFFALPMASVPLLGSFTGPRLAGEAPEDGWLALLWLIPLASAGTVGLGALLQFRSDVTPASRRTAFTVVLVLSALVVTTCLIALTRIEAAIGGTGAFIRDLHATDLMGLGFWLGLAAMLASGGAAVAELRKPSAAASGEDVPEAAVVESEATVQSMNAAVSPAGPAETVEGHPVDQPATIIQEGDASTPPSDEDGAGEPTDNLRRIFLLTAVTGLVVVLAVLIISQVRTGEPSTPATAPSQRPVPSLGETDQASQAAASPTPVDIGGTLDVWLVGGPGEAAPSATLPTAFTQFLAAHNVTANVISTSADDFERDYTAAAGRGEAPEIVAGRNYLPMENLLDNRKLPVTWVTGPIELVMDRAFVFLPKSADRHDAAIRLAVADNECPAEGGSPRPKLDQAAVDVAEQGVRGAALAGESGLTPLLSSRSLGFAHASAPSTKIHALRVCQAVGNDTAGLVIFAAVTSTDTTAGRVYTSLVVVRDEADWRILSVLPFAAYDELVRAFEQIEDGPPGTAAQVSLTLLEPDDGVAPTPSSENFQYYRWKTQGAVDQVLAEFAELVRPNGKSLLLPAERTGDDTHARLGNSSFGGTLKWRVWAIMKDGSVVFSDMRQHES